METQVGAEILAGVEDQAEEADQVGAEILAGVEDQAEEADQVGTGELAAVEQVGAETQVEVADPAEGVHLVGVETLAAETAAHLPKEIAKAEHQVIMDSAPAVAVEEVLAADMAVETRVEVADLAAEKIKQQQKASLTVLQGSLKV